MPRFNAGWREGSYPDSETGHPTPVAYWYPTATAERPVRRGPFELCVAPDAPVAEGSFPAVVISHGSGGSAIAHRDTARSLARAGFVVSVPLHARNNFLDNSDEGTLHWFHERPRQLSAAIDALLDAPGLAGRIDRGRIGAMGFSAGAFAVLTSAGGVADLRLIGGHCDAHPDDAFCIGGRELGYSFPAQADPNAFVVSPTPDHRIRAAVLLAPLGIVFAAGSLDRVTIPIRLYGAEKDESLTSPFHVERVQALLPRPPECSLVPGAGHFAFISPFPASFTGRHTRDPDGFDRAQFQQRFNAEVSDFFTRVLAPDRPPP